MNDAVEKIEVEKDEAEKSGALSAIILAVLVVLVSAYCVAYGLQTLVWLEARHWSTVNPWLQDVPQPLPSSTINATPSAKGTLVKAYDYEFLSPWGAAKITPYLAHVEFRFPAGQVALLFDPETSIDTMRNMKSTNPLEYQKFTNVFVDHPIEFNYQLYDMVYGASPAQLSPIMPSRDAMRMNVLLLWKLSFGFDTTPGIYSIEFGKNHGVQFGEPGKGRPVAVRFFDDRDRQFRLIFLVAAGSNAPLTQGDINMAVTSFKPVPIIDR
ncbi:MAG TPA: hypothetical protein VEX69_03040 [Candidatus Limnocylindria bacterium]|nr:hypothetical protein [Candidatus Limnocylindria bacterium]